MGNFTWIILGIVILGGGYYAYKKGWFDFLLQPAHLAQNFSQSDQDKLAQIRAKNLGITPEQAKTQIQMMN